MDMLKKPYFLLMFIHFVLAFGLVSACGTKKPAVVEDGLKDPYSNIGHVNFVGNCADCHESERKAPATDLNLTVTHGLGADCSTCHTFPVFTNIRAEVKAHNPAPTQCMGCHDRQTEKTVHPPYGECAGCHRFGPAWVPF